MSEHTPLTEAGRGALREWALGVKRHNARCSIEPDTLLDLLDLAARTSTATADERGAWVCGVCGEGGPAHQAGGSRGECAFEPVWKPLAATADTGLRERVRVGFRYQDGEILSPEREAESADEEVPVVVLDLGDGEWLTLADLRAAAPTTDTGARD